MAAAPNIFTKLNKRIWLTLLILLICVLISVYFAVFEQKAINNFFEKVFNPDASKVLTVTTPIFIGLIIGFFINVLSSDFLEWLKKKDSDNDNQQTPLLPKIEITNIIQPESKPVASPITGDQKFYPNFFLPELKFFVGRTEILKQIKETLAIDHRATIHDISGLGKTFTTYKFADENQNNYDKIFFIRATKEEMLESLAKCGELVNPQLVSVEEQKNKADGFKQWLEENENWLVIYDNVDIPKELFHFVPVNKKGDCIFTSNFREVTELGTEIDIAKLSPGDAEILLFSRANNKPRTIPDLQGDEKAAFDNLIGEIDGLPLTLNSMGAFIYKKDLTFARFWQKYENSPKIAWESEDDYSTYQRKSAGIVFSLAYDELTQDPKVGKAVRTLLNAMSFLSPDEIPEDLLQEILRKNLGFFARLRYREDNWDDVRERLTGYDLLKYNKDKCIFTTHRSIQRVIQTKLAAKEVKNVCIKLSETFLKLFPKYDHFNRPECEKYSQHVQTLLENSDKFHIENKNTVSLYFKLGRYYELLGNFDNAERFYLCSSDISGKVFGKESADYATSLNNLAIVYQSQGRYNEAVKKYEEALRIDEKTIGKEHPDYATHLNNLASVYKAQGRYDEAIEKYKEALRIDEKTIGKEHPYYAARLNNLATVYEAQGRYDEAIEKYEEALRIDEKTIGKENPDYAIDLNNLAIVYEAQGRYDDAIEKYEEALQIGRNTIGKEHPDYATRLNNLASVYKAQGRYDEAVEKYEQALRIDEKTIGKEHPGYALHLSNLAGVYEAQGKYKEAFELYEAALNIFEKTLPENHPYTLQSRESVERCQKILKIS